ncbi:FG-GAP repeat domain-containing protein [Planktotalea sp.]|uniref:FG-GAP repeat domain-containing protein n=1 Tax=Planktotalea sp. TaxID=2029877 RepID=UPI003F6C4BC9
MRIGAFCLALICASPVFAGVKEARYSEPTTRYAHGILGDAIEFGALEIVTDAGKSITLRLPETRVFEDLEPRLVDVDFDGDAEIVVIESSISQGARLAIYDESGLVSATPYIGQTNRWLAPLGAADLDGDGAIELAYIDRPHLAKTLRIWRFENGALRHVADQTGLTNHRIGEDFISGGVLTCDGVAQIVSADANWSRIMISEFRNGKISSRDAGSFSKAKLQARSTTCP